MILRRIFTTLFFSFFTLVLFSQVENQYYTFKQLDSIYHSNQNALKAIINSDIDKLIINDCNLNDIETQINYLEYLGLDNFFDFKNTNHIELYQNFKNLIVEIKQNRTIINQQISNIDYWYFKTAKDFLTNVDTSSAFTFLDKSLQFNFMYVLSINLKTNLLIEKNKIIEATSFLTQYANIYYPDYEYFKLFYTTVLQLNSSLIKKSNHFYNTGYYNESMLYFQYADSLCKAFNLYNCSDFTTGIINSKKGLYNSYLRIANQAITTNNYNIAESFTDKALEYALVNRDAIGVDIETDKNYKLFVYKYLSFSAKYKQKNNNKSADFYWQKANRICNLLQLHDCDNLNIAKNENIDLPDNASTDVISENKVIVQTNIVSINNENKPKSTKYKNKKSVITKNKTNTKQQNLNKVQNNIAENLIEIGNELYSKSKFEDAYQKYISAKQLLSSDNKSNKSKIDIYINQTALKIIFLPLKDINFILWSDEFEKIDSILNLSRNLQEKYLMHDNIEVNNELKRIEDNKNNKQCRSIDEKISLLCSKAISLFEIKEFQKVQITVDEAERLIKKHNNCKFNLADFYKISSLIKPITSYFTFLNLAKTNYENLNFQVFTNHFLTADSIYKHQNFDSLMIPNNNLISFLKYQNNDTVNLKITDMLLLKKQQNECFQLLNVLRENKFTAINTKKIQEDLVKLVAENHQLDLVYLSIKYPFLKDEKWFKYFIKSYNTLKKNK